MSLRQLLLVGNPVDEDWEFRRGVEDASEKKWDVKTIIINRYDGMHKYTRYVNYILKPFGLFLRRGQYETILSWEQFLALVFAFYENLFHVKKYPELTVMGFIYKPKKGAVGHLFKYFVRTAVKSDYVRRLVVYGKSEIPYYSALFGVDEDKFVSEILGQTDKTDLIKVVNSPEQRYYIAAGRSNRDYSFLREAWPDNADELKIVCDVEKSDDTANIHYEKDCHGDDYFRLMAGAYVSIVPLGSEKFSSGQLVFLHSAMFGKPVIATRNNTVADYIEDGETGFIIDKDAASLLDAVRKLEDPDLYQRMSRNARNRFEERFSLYELGRRMGKLVSGK